MSTQTDAKNHADRQKGCVLMSSKQKPFSFNFRKILMKLSEQGSQPRSLFQRPPHAANSKSRKQFPSLKHCSSRQKGMPFSLKAKILVDHERVCGGLSTPSISQKSVLSSPFPCQSFVKVTTTRDERSDVEENDSGDGSSN